MQPLVIMFRRNDGKIETHITPSSTDGYEAYGLLVCDLVRNIAGAFGVPDGAVWEWVDKERGHPTTSVDIKWKGRKSPSPAIRKRRKSTPS